MQVNSTPSSLLFNILIQMPYQNREASLNGADMELVSSLPQASPNIESGQLNHLRLRSATEGHNTRLCLTNPAQDPLRRVRSANTEKFGDGGKNVSSPACTKGFLSPHTSEMCLFSGRSSSLGSGHSISSSSDMTLVPYQETGESESGLELSAVPQSKEDFHHSSPASILVCAQLFEGYTCISYGAGP